MTCRLLCLYRVKAINLSIRKIVKYTSGSLMYTCHRDIIPVATFVVSI